MFHQRAAENRLASALVGGEDAGIDDALSAAKEQLKGHNHDPSKVATCSASALQRAAPTSPWSRWLHVPGRAISTCAQRPLGRGDDILASEDKNPNTRGVMQIASTTPPRPIAELLEAIDADEYQYGDRARLRARGRRDRGAQGALLLGVVTIARIDGPLAKAAHIAPPARGPEADGTYVNTHGPRGWSERLRPVRRTPAPAGSWWPAWLRAWLRWTGRSLRRTGHARGVRRPRVPSPTTIALPTSAAPSPPTPTSRSPSPAASPAPAAWSRRAPRAATAA